jgi:hypothetical protein
MQDTDFPPPQALLDSIPEPDIIRTWLGQSIKQAALLRSLLRVAERKANYRDSTATRKELAPCR